MKLHIYDGTERRGVRPALIGVIAVLAGSLGTFASVSAGGRKSSEPSDPRRTVSAVGAPAAHSTTPIATEQDDLSFAPRMVDVPDCVGVAGYSVTAAAPDDLIGLFVGSPSEPGGATVAIRGHEDSLSLLPQLEARKVFTPDRSGGAFWSPPGAADVVSVGSKRVSQATFDELVSTLSTGRLNPPAGLTRVKPSTAQVQILGTACDVGDQFYGVEVVQGDPSARAFYLLSVDPARVLNGADVSVAIFSPKDKPEVSIRPVTASEWNELSKPRSDQGSAALPPELRQ